MEVWGCFLMSGVRMLHFFKEWRKFIKILQYYGFNHWSFNTCNVHFRFLESINSVTFHQIQRGLNQLMLIFNMLQKLQITSIRGKWRSDSGDVFFFFTYCSFLWLNRMSQNSGTLEFRYFDLFKNMYNFIRYIHVRVEHCLLKIVIPRSMKLVE